MPSGLLVYSMIARHGAAIDRLKRDMLAEESHEALLVFLAYDAAGFLYAFLIATGNDVSPRDRTLRNALQAAIIEVLEKHGINPSTFCVWPDIAAPVKSLS
ncbi:hypothetical protein GCM10023264_11680 [Sphingomonas daechungensis]|uniref:Uncharacterized protein n=1 Tax=Sphingomonas daechungensis TaxID=1176646 RepID=A0ABX6T0Z0_9SPHN|nr:hypothetical protein [Sphingomonas daechungensis]QNP42398.1 hypothetical protein H9L15_08720 [Sphingomonas daechungensis]